MWYAMLMAPLFEMYIVLLWLNIQQYLIKRILQKLLYEIIDYLDIHNSRKCALLRAIFPSWKKPTAFESWRRLQTYQKQRILLPSWMLQTETWKPSILSNIKKKQISMPCRKWYFSKCVPLVLWKLILNRWKLII